MAASFDRDELLNALDEVGRAAIEVKARLDIAVYGGSALMLASNFRFGTEDVDIAELQTPWPQWLTDVVHYIAARNGWSEEWLNDGVTFHLSSHAVPARDLVSFGTFPRRNAQTGITVFVPTARYMLALKLKASFLPPPPTATDLDMPARDRISGKFAFLAVTTLDKLLLSNTLGGEGRGPLKVVAIEESAGTVLRALAAGITGGYKGKKMRGIHFEEVDEVTIHGESSHLILDGETFCAEPGFPIHLGPAQPLSFVKLAA